VTLKEEASGDYGLVLQGVSGATAKREKLQIRLSSIRLSACNSFNEEDQCN
jgi:hypothetical protein